MRQEVDVRGGLHEVLAVCVHPWGKLRKYVLEANLNQLGLRHS